MFVGAATRRSGSPGAACAAGAAEPASAPVAARDTTTARTRTRRRHEGEIIRSTSLRGDGQSPEPFEDKRSSPSWGCNTADAVRLRTRIRVPETTSGGAVNTAPPERCDPDDPAWRQPATLPPE